MPKGIVGGGVVPDSGDAKPRRYAAPPARICSPGQGTRDVASLEILMCRQRSGY